jgi:hypothetical protein
VHRTLFNARAPDGDRALYRVHQKDGGYVLAAGSVHGISLCSLFAVYATRDLARADTPLGTLSADSVDAFETKLALWPGAPPFVLPDHGGFALQTGAGAEEALRLHVPLKNGLQAVFEALVLELQGRQPRARAILLVDVDKAELAVNLSEDQHICFALTDALVTGYGLRRLHGTVPQDARAVHAVLQGAKNFFWHLRHSPDKGKLRAKVDVALHQLEPTSEVDENLEEIYLPVGGNLVRDGFADVWADMDTEYGVTITNKSDVPLFVSLFFFDCSDLSISASLSPSPSLLVVYALSELARSAVLPTAGLRA